MDLTRTSRQHYVARHHSRRRQRRQRRLVTQCCASTILLLKDEAVPIEKIRDTIASRDEREVLEAVASSGTVIIVDPPTSTKDALSMVDQDAAASSNTQTQHLLDMLSSASAEDMDVLAATTYEPQKFPTTKRKRKVQEQEWEAVQDAQSAVVKSIVPSAALTDGVYQEVPRKVRRQKNAFKIAETPSTTVAPDATTVNRRRNHLKNYRPISPIVPIAPIVPFGSVAEESHAADVTALPQLSDIVSILDHQKLQGEALPVTSEGIGILAKYGQGGVKEAQGSDPVKLEEPYVPYPRNKPNGISRNGPLLSTLQTQAPLVVADSVENVKIVEKPYQVETAEQTAEDQWHPSYEHQQETAEYKIHENPKEGHGGGGHGHGGHGHGGHGKDGHGHHGKDGHDHGHGHHGKDGHGKDGHGGHDGGHGKGGGGGGDAGKDHKFEEGAGEEHEEDHHESHGDKGEKEYKSWHDYDKGEKGHHDKEAESHHYDEKDGHEKKHHEEGGYHDSHDHGEKGHKEAEFDEKGEHQEGHSTKGQHSVHKKDEYEKKTEFFDEFEEDGGMEKGGDYHHEHEHEEGGHEKSSHHDHGHHEEHHGKEKKHEEGHHHHDHKGHKKDDGHEHHHHHDEKHGKKLDHKEGKKWAYKKGDDGGSGGGKEGHGEGDKKGHGEGDKKGHGDGGKGHH
ncbi:filaggrin-2 isoform X4 [Cephus cinctus]|uniref:Filaggrin-2 isoform X4 n=1 Tax=Cephus cinctus TaxID=211228 RepID=A0AAJ7RRK9_CEPCN|nr:filaggrin-2 isoform X4 [Cephus cinctus]